MADIITINVSVNSASPLKDPKFLDILQDKVGTALTYAFGESGPCSIQVNGTQVREMGWTNIDPDTGKSEFHSWIDKNVLG